MPFQMSRVLPDRGVTVTYAMMMTLQLDFRSNMIVSVVGSWITEADYLAGAAPLYQEQVVTNMGDLPPHTIEAVESALAQRGDWLTGATIVPQAVQAVSLDAYREQCRSQIDALASACRLRFISTGVGQDASYIAKEADARAYIAAGSPEDAGAFPWIAGEAAATGATASAVAATIIARAEAWRGVIGPQIESVRIDHKGRLSTANDTSTADAVVAAARAAFNAIGA